MEKNLQPLLLCSSHHVYIEVDELERGKLGNDIKITSHAVELGFKPMTIQKNQPLSDCSRRNLQIEVGQKYPSKLIRIPRSSAEVFISSRRENSAPCQGSQGLS
jgi:hypothetical protein